MSNPDIPLDIHELKLNIDHKLDNIYRLLHIQRPKSASIKNRSSVNTTFFNSTHQKQEILHNFDMSFNLNPMTTKNKKKQGFKNRVFTDRVLTTKARKAQPIFTQRPANNKDKTLINHLNNKNNSFEKVITSRKKIQESIQKQKLEKLSMKRIQMNINNKIFQKLRSQIQQNTKMQRNQTQAASKLRSELIIKIEKLRKL